MKNKLFTLFVLAVYFSMLYTMLLPFICILYLTMIPEDKVDMCMLITFILYMILTMSISYKLLFGGDD